VAVGASVGADVGGGGALTAGAGAAQAAKAKPAARHKLEVSFFVMNFILQMISSKPSQAGH
jgi:hypothetical protein